MVLVVLKVGELAVVRLARATNCRVPRIGIGRAPENRVGFRIVRADVPRQAAAEFVGVAFPGIATGLARCRHGVEIPHLLAGLLVISDQRTAGTVFTTTKTGDNNTLNGQRRRRDHRALGVVDDLGAPLLFAGFGIQCDQMSVQAADENHAIRIGHATAVHVAAGEGIMSSGSSGS